MTGINLFPLQDYSTFIFDFDYTLADSSKGILTCFRIVLNRHDLNNITDEAIKRTIGMTVEDSFGQITGVEDRETLLPLKTEYLEEADKIMSANTVFYPEALTFLRQIKEQGGRIGIVSTKQSRIIKETIDSYNVSGLFDIVIGSEEVKAAKPNPEGLLLAMDKLEAIPSRTLYFGDSIIDAKTAHAGDIDFIGITTGATTKEELDKYPHKLIVHSLGGIVSI